MEQSFFQDITGVLEIVAKNVIPSSDYPWGYLAYLLLIVPGSIFLVLLKYSKYGNPDVELEMKIEKKKAFLVTAFTIGIGLSVLAFLYTLAFLYIFLPLTLPFVFSARQIEIAAALIFAASYLWFFKLLFDFSKKGELIETLKRQIRYCFGLLGAAVGVFMMMTLILGLTRHYVTIPNIILTSEPYVFILGIIMFGIYESFVVKFLELDYAKLLPNRAKLEDILLMLPFYVVSIPLNLGRFFQKILKINFESYTHKNKPRTKDDFIAYNEGARERAKNLIVDLWLAFPDIRISESEVKKAIKTNIVIENLVKEGYLFEDPSHNPETKKTERWFGIGPNGIQLVHTWEIERVTNVSLIISFFALLVALLALLR